MAKLHHRVAAAVPDGKILLPVSAVIPCTLAPLPYLCPQLLPSICFLVTKQLGACGEDCITTSIRDHLFSETVTGRGMFWGRESEGADGQQEFLILYDQFFL